MVRKGSKRLYTIDDKILKTNLRLFGNDFRCQFCGEKFIMGDIVYAVYSKNIKWYHKKCYELTLYDG